MSFYSFLDTLFIYFLKYLVLGVFWAKYMVEPKTLGQLCWNVFLGYVFELDKVFTIYFDHAWTVFTGFT